MSRLDDLAQLYELFDALEESSGGMRFLAPLASPGQWPRRGVYFFFEHGELRTDGQRLRLVRVGTHGLTDGARSTLHQRLRQHAGKSTRAGGNHRGSIFRLLIGEALMARGDCPPCRSWGVGGDTGRAADLLHMDRGTLAANETPIEAAVSDYLGRMPFLWLSIEDEPGPRSLRSFIERNVIALASSFQESAVGAPSPSWLGLHSPRNKVRLSGLWNQRHVDEHYNPTFLDTLESLVGSTTPSRSVP